MPIVLQVARMVGKKAVSARKGAETGWGEAESLEWIM